MMPIDVSARAAATRDRLAESGAGTLIVTDLTNLRWLTGFTGSNGFGIVLPDELVLVTDGRYGDQAERQLAAAHADGGRTRVLVGRTGGQVLDLVAETVSHVASVGFESAHVSHQQFVDFGERFRPTLVPTLGVIERGRRTKDAAEIERMAQACAIADSALAEVARSIRPGRTEAEIRNALEIRMRELGASGPSYETIVATGPTNAPLPHHRPTPTEVQDGHTVIIDVGALYEGYHSDMTRTFLVGTPTALQQEVYDVVLAAQTAGVAAVRPGITTAELDAVCRNIISSAGLGEWFIHGTGHGVGLLIHEDPFVNSAGRDELQVGDVVTVEPGVYREDFGGVRVEDLVLVTSTGCRVLTSSPKDFPCLPSAPTT